jgi:hypothetical protein
MIMGHRDPLDEVVAEGGVTVDGGGGGGVQSPTMHQTRASVLFYTKVMALSCSSIGRSRRGMQSLRHTSVS